MSNRDTKSYVVVLTLQGGHRMPPLQINAITVPRENFLGQEN